MWESVIANEELSTKLPKFKMYVDKQEAVQAGTDDSPPLQAIAALTTHHYIEAYACAKEAYDLHANEGLGTKLPKFRMYVDKQEAVRAGADDSPTLQADTK